MIFAAGTDNTTRHRGATSTYHSNQRGQPDSAETRGPEPVALAENERVLKNQNDPERKASALAWLFHLVGDIHQPLHTAQLFTVDYPKATGVGTGSVCG